MYPVLLKLGPLPVHSYGLMLALGFLAGLFLARRDAPKFGLDPDKIADAAFWVLLLAIAGTRVAFIMMFPEDFSWSKPLGWFAIWNGGLVFQGAIPPAIVFIYYWTRKHKMPFWTVGDLAVPCLALGHAIGRLGCFLNGCCYGARTELSLAIRFPRVPFEVLYRQPGVSRPCTPLWSRPKRGSMVLSRTPHTALQQCRVVILVCIINYIT